MLDDGTERQVLCGNMKLMKSQRVFSNDGEYEVLKKNIIGLEEQGKTVVVLAIDHVP